MNPKDARSELREAIRAALEGDEGDPWEILAFLKAKHGEEWVTTRARLLLNCDSILIREIRDQFHLRRKNFDHEVIHAAADDPNDVIEDETPLGDSWSYFNNRLDSALGRLRDVAIREYLLNFDVVQPMPDGSSKPRREMTRDDLLLLAERQRKNAVGNAGLMMAFARLADLMQEQGVVLLGEIDILHVQAA